MSGAGERRDSLLGRLATLAEAAALVGVALFGLGWIFAARLYGSMGFTPEELGVDFAFLVVRVGLITVGSLVGMLVLIVLAGQEDRLREVSSSGVTLRSRSLILLVFSMAMVTMALEVAIVLFIEPWLWTDSRIVGWIIAALLTVALMVGTALVGLSIFRFAGLRHPYTNVNLKGTVVLSACALMVAALAIVAAVSGADWVSSHPRNGEDFRRLGLNLPLVSVYPASYVPLLDEMARHPDLTDEDAEEAALGCVTLVGINDGVAFLYSDKEPARSVRTPVEGIVVVSSPECQGHEPQDREH